VRIQYLEPGPVYDGLQLSTAFFDRQLPGGQDGILLFVSEADVPSHHMVDLEDAEAGESIYSPLMAHVLVERREIGLREGVLAQRLLARLAADWISSRSGVTVHVQGDDLFVVDGKLSVSVATRSPRGVLIHLGVNVDIAGAPVKAAGLRDLRVPPEEFLRGVARAFARELDSVEHAVGKVRAVS